MIQNYNYSLHKPIGIEKVYVLQPLYLSPNETELRA